MIGHPLVTMKGGFTRLDDPKATRQSPICVVALQGVEETFDSPNVCAGSRFIKDLLDTERL